GGPTLHGMSAAAAAAVAVANVDLHSDLSYRIVHALLTAMTDLPLSELNHELHVELSNLMLVLLSAQVYVPMSPLYQHANIFLAHALLGPFARGPSRSGVGAGRSAELVKKLVDNCL